MITSILFGPKAQPKPTPRPAAETTSETAMPNGEGGPARSKGSAAPATPQSVRPEPVPPAAPSALPAQAAIAAARSTEDAAASRGPDRGEAPDLAKQSSTLASMVEPGPSDGDLQARLAAEAQRRTYRLELSISEIAAARDARFDGPTGSAAYANLPKTAYAETAALDRGPAKATLVVV